MYFGRFIRRYKRFMVDIESDHGQVITLHCPNSGRMTGLLDLGNLCAYTKSTNEKRKFPYTLEMIHADGVWVGVNTQRPNNLVQDFLIQEGIGFQREAFYTKDTRFDFAVLKNGLVTGYIEVKNVHMKRANKAFFPDAPTTRGHKHLDALCEVMARGLNAYLIYVVQRSDCQDVGVADDIDPIYAKKYKHALNMGLQVIQLHYDMSPDYENLAVLKKLPDLIPRG